jgi:hypothetical protein
MQSAAVYKQHFVSKCVIDDDVFCSQPERPPRFFTFCPVSHTLNIVPVLFRHPKAPEPDFEKDF